MDDWKTWQEAVIGAMGLQRRAACPRHLKRRVRAALQRSGDRFHDAVEEILDLGPEEVGFVRHLVRELPELARRWKATGSLHVVANEAHQQAGSPAAGLTLADLLEVDRVIRGVVGHGHSSLSVSDREALCFVAKYLLKAAEV